MDIDDSTPEERQTEQLKNDVQRLKQRIETLEEKVRQIIHWSHTGRGVEN